MRTTTRTRGRATPTAGASGSLELRDVSKHYGTLCAADNVNLSVADGEFVTLLGPSGSGKTTTLQIIAGFVEATSGEVLIDGRPVTAPPHQRDIGMVFQNYALFPHMTAARNVEYPLMVRRIDRRARRQRVAEALDMVGLADRGEQYPKRLSGGQQQRIALARALVFRPRIVLLDEPLGALDKKLREHLQLEIKRIQRRTGITMLYVTHDQEEALVMSDRIAVFDQGAIQQVGTPHEVYERPSSVFVATFVGESNLFHGHVRGGRLYSDELVLAVPGHAADGPSALLVRPERMGVGAVPAGEVNVVEAVVEEVVYLGGELRYTLVAGDGRRLIARRPAETRSLPPGEPVTAWWRVQGGVPVPGGGQGEGERQRAGGRGSEGEGERQRAGGRGSG
jgi:putative spermidine/putrescine transport system ATP-binding protein